MIPPDLQRRVAHIDVLSGMVFPSSVSYWRSRANTESRWVTRESQTEPVLIGDGDALEINNDSNANISAPDGGIVHINGDLNANLEIAGHHEVILSGNVSRKSTISASGFHHIYIGGSVYGRIVITGSSNIWIDGDYTGSLGTGSPSTNIHVLGNFSADLAPAEGDAALLWLAVGGYADNDLISSIAAIGYTQFNATVGRSDVTPGLYPAGEGRRKTESGNSFSRWCVLTQGGAKQTVVHGAAGRAVW